MHLTLSHRSSSYLNAVQTSKAIFYPVHTGPDPPPAIRRWSVLFVADSPGRKGHTNTSHIIHQIRSIAFLDIRRLDDTPPPPSCPKASSLMSPTSPLLLRPRDQQLLRALRQRRLPLLLPKSLATATAMAAAPAKARATGAQSTSLPTLLQRSTALPRRRRRPRAWTRPNHSTLLFPPSLHVSPKSADGYPNCPLNSSMTLNCPTNPLPPGVGVRARNVSHPRNRGRRSQGWGTSRSCVPSARNLSLQHCSTGWRISRITGDLVRRPGRLRLAAQGDSEEDGTRPPLVQPWV